jgi:hypothetical protein
MPTYTYGAVYTIGQGGIGEPVVGTLAAAGLEITSSDSVLTSGSTLVGQAFYSPNGNNLNNTTTFAYDGSFVVNGQYVGFAVYDTANKMTYLITNSLSVNPSDPLTIDYAGNSALPNTLPNYDLSNNGSATAACFLSGTAIETPGGDVAVETLRPGDLVTVNDGRVLPVSWLGRQTVSRRFAEPLRTLPIRIKAEALGPNQPQRDLLLSPDHALLVDGVLVQAGALVNGVSIVRETDMPPVFTYYHVEVADHSLVFAEGVPAETFIDNVDRLAFDNWAEHEALVGVGVAITEMDLPRAKAVRQVPAGLRARLAARAAELYGTEVASAA